MKATPRHHGYDPTTLPGAIKLQAWERGVYLRDCARHLGLRPDTLRARLSVSRGKRALQPHQVTALAELLAADVTAWHRLGAQHEGWKV